MKKIVLFIIVSSILLLTFSSHNNSYAKNVDITKKIPKDIEEKLKMQEEALQAYEKIWDYFSKENETPAYPEEYGGEYIENDMLYIEIVGRDDAIEEKYKEICNHFEKIDFIDVRYSLKYLISLEEICRKEFLEYDLVSFGVDRKNNRFTIGVIEKNYDALSDKVNELKLSDVIDVVKEERPEVCTANLYGGDRIFKSSNNDGCSVCIGGYYNGFEAVLTCGHGNENYPFFTRNGALVGQVVKQQCNTSYYNTSSTAYGEYAIINCNGNYVGTNLVRNATGLVSISAYSIPVGSYICKYGSTTGFSSGSVTNVDKFVSFGSAGQQYYYLYKMIESEMSNSTNTDAVYYGDSGGSVYYYNNGYRLQGLVSGGAQLSNPNVIHKTMYTAPIKYAIDAGFTPKTN